MIHTVIEIKNFLKAGFSCLSLSSHSVVTLVQLGLEGGTVVLSTSFLDGCGWVNQVLGRDNAMNI